MCGSLSKLLGMVGLLMMLLLLFLTADLQSFRLSLTLFPCPFLHSLKINQSYSLLLLAHLLPLMVFVVSLTLTRSIGAALKNTNSWQFVGEGSGYLGSRLTNNYFQEIAGSIVDTSISVTTRNTHSVAKKETTIHTERELNSTELECLHG